MHILTTVLAWADTNGPRCTPIGRGPSLLLALEVYARSTDIRKNVIKAHGLAIRVHCVQKIELRPQTSSRSSTPPAPLLLFLSPEWIPQVKPTDRTKQKRSKLLAFLGQEAVVR